MPVLFFVGWIWIGVIGSLKPNLSSKKPFGLIPSGFAFQAALDDLRQPETRCAMERRRFADMLINQRSLI